MKVRVLGTAAGGGLPQWNCACETCEHARKRDIERSQDCLAISADGTRWYLVNASPDIRAQILRTPELQPGPERRQTPLAGVVFSSAELDHTLGLVALREAVELRVLATPTVLDALPWRALIGSYGGFRWEPLAGEVALDETLSVRAVPIGRKRPRYAAGDADDWVVALRFTDAATGGVLVYAPCLGEWSAAFAATLDGASCLILDGSFHTDDEMVLRAGAGPTSKQMGHLPVVESLPHRADHPGLRWLYTHLNNTNPLLLQGTPERVAVMASYAEIADDGMLINL